MHFTPCQHSKDYSQRVLGTLEACDSPGQAGLQLALGSLRSIHGGHEAPTICLHPPVLQMRLVYLVGEAGPKRLGLCFSRALVLKRKLVFFQAKLKKDLGSIWESHV